MFAQPLSPSPRALLGAGLLGLAALGALAAPAAAQSVGPERALLNLVPGSYRVVAQPEPPLTAIDGGRALLGRWASGTPAAQGVATPWAEEPSAVSGERALLGTVAPGAQRRLVLAR